MLTFLKKIPWGTVLLVVALIVFDMSMHQLNSGPDRLIHDPAVYRLGNPNYFPGDWYTGMAIKSGVYVFYAILVHAGGVVHIPEEIWRTLLYLTGLTVLFTALIRIARLFSANWLVIPLLVLLHAILLTGGNQPIWLYGPFMAIDGGLAPRSIGVALSFLALYYLMRKSLPLAGLILGIATLVHVSNSFIVFSLFFIVWAILTWLDEHPLTKKDWLAMGRKAALGIGVYLLAGGWFAFFVASRGGATVGDFAPDKFVWTWIYLRAPYMALPFAGTFWWFRLGLHVAVIIVAWLWLRKWLAPATHWALNTISLVGLGAVGYFFVFYFFAFVRPWIPGFDFYSLRIIYFTYGTAYLLASVLFFMVVERIVKALMGRLKPSALFLFITNVLAAIVFLWGLIHVLGVGSFHHPKKDNLRESAYHVLDSMNATRKYVPNNKQEKPFAGYATLRYISAQPEPFLAPPNLPLGYHYLPSIVSYKSLGFTEEGLAEWYTRLNDVTQGYLEQVYQSQKDNPRPIEVDWHVQYAKLTPEVVESLAQKYHFRLFLTYRNLEFPFAQVAEDGDYRLYLVPQNTVN
jgi:hypothetical protein